MHSCRDGPLAEIHRELTGTFGGGSSLLLLRASSNAAGNTGAACLGGSLDDRRGACPRIRLYPLQTSLAHVSLPNLTRQPPLFSRIGPESAISGSSGKPSSWGGARRVPRAPDVLANFVKRHSSPLSPLSLHPYPCLRRPVWLSHARKGGMGSCGRK
jgi:hypothetical protein